MAYYTADGRVHIIRRIVRGDWNRRRNQQGGKSILWDAFDVQNKKYITQERFTLRSIKRKLVEEGYCSSEKTCRLVKDKADRGSRKR